MNINQFLLPDARRTDIHLVLVDRATTITNLRDQSQQRATKRHEPRNLTAFHHRQAGMEEPFRCTVRANNLVISAHHNNRVR